MFPSNPRRVYDSYRYDWQQQNSSRGMASAMEVPLRDAIPSVVHSLHFPHNYYGSIPPALPDIASRSEESMVSFFAFWLLLMSSCALRVIYQNKI